jgi:hypothetical protein
MPRPCKAVVDYFPHYIGNGKTIFNLESEFGNDGYAFWFKLLELLGDTENHFYDCNKPKHWRYLLSKTRFKEQDAISILNLLVELEAIDGELWENKVIWSSNFVENLSGLYSRREISPYTKEDIKGFCIHKQPLGGIDDDINPQSKVKESKVNKSIGAGRFAPPTVTEITAYCKERNNDVDAERFHDFYQAKGWMVGKNKMSDWKAAVRTWEKKDRAEPDKPSIYDRRL